jgi:hypothetical protein
MLIYVDFVSISDILVAFSEAGRISKIKEAETL